MTTMREEVLYEVLMDLRKAYVALDRGICMEIMFAYGVGPRAEHLLCRYWDRLTMIARLGSYYTTLLKGYRGVTLGNLMSPTIFNMVANSVICHCLTVVSGRMRV